MTAGLASRAGACAQRLTGCTLAVGVDALQAGPGGPGQGGSSSSNPSTSGPSSSTTSAGGEGDGGGTNVSAYAASVLADEPMAYLRFEDALAANRMAAHFAARSAH